jgi:hypothetical protein
MTHNNGAAAVLREASDLLSKLRASVGRPRYGMGDTVGVAIEVTPVDGVPSNQYRIEVLCHAFGNVDASWDRYCAVLRDGEGNEYTLGFDGLGQARLYTKIAPEMVLHGIDIREIDTTETIWAQSAAAKTAVGELFADATEDFVSPDGRVRARVHCTAGGDLDVTFTASSVHEDLRGATITLRFFTDTGSDLKGKTALWPDEGVERQLAAIWTGNQTSLAPGGQEQIVESGKMMRLDFEFEIEPKGERGATEQET